MNNSHSAVPKASADSSLRHVVDAAATSLHCCSFSIVCDVLPRKAAVRFPSTSALDTIVQHSNCLKYRQALAKKLSDVGLTESSLMQFATDVF